MRAWYQQNANEVMSDLLDLDPDEKAVVTLGEWTEVRHMQSVDGEFRFQQQREKNGEWLVTEFLAPDGLENWFWITKTALEHRWPVPQVGWMGPINDIPDELLRGDSPLMVRGLETPGWMNLRKMAKMACRGEA